MPKISSLGLFLFVLGGPGCLSAGGDQNDHGDDHDLATPPPAVVRQDLDTSGAMPPGMMMMFAGVNPPKGWWLCDGKAISQVDYPDLHSAIGSAWGDGGDGDGPLFNIPDLRGYFVRGVDSGAKHDPEAATRGAISQGGNSGDRVGSMQEGATALPKKSFLVPGTLATVLKQTLFGGSSSDLAQPGAVNPPITAGGDQETRPQNVAVNYLIKY